MSYIGPEKQLEALRLQWIAGADFQSGPATSVAVQWSRHAGMTFAPFAGMRDSFERFAAVAAACDRQVQRDLLGSGAAFISEWQERSARPFCAVAIREPSIDPRCAVRRAGGGPCNLDGGDPSQRCGPCRGAKVPKNYKQRERAKGMK